MTSAPLTAPQASPAASTPATPSAVIAGEPTTMAEARQLARMNTVPTDRSMPAVSTAKPWATATSASSTPLLAAVCTMLALRPPSCLIP